MARTSRSALDGLFEACATDPGCHGAFPDLRAEFEEIEKQLTRGVEVTLPDLPGKSLLSRGRVIEWMRSLLYRPRSAADIPWYIHQAYGGNWAPIGAAIVSQSRTLDQELSLGLLFAISCSEDIPFLDDPAIIETSRGTYLGDYRVRQQQKACESWPRSVLATGGSLYQRLVESGSTQELAGATCAPMPRPAFKTIP
jgi:hypothetical protein